MQRLNIVYLLIIVGVISSCKETPVQTIIIPESPDAYHSLAAKELRRYIFHRSDQLLTIVESDQTDNFSGDIIVIAGKDTKPGSIISETFQDELQSLDDQSFLIKTSKTGDQTVTYIIGGGPMGTLYGTYDYIEQLGIRFYLHGDVIPDEKITFTLPGINKTGKPLFETRGILPFHDFPEGPDWWNVEDYKAIITQLIKLKMNFIGFHTYPEVSNYPSGYCQAEPMVWIGNEEDIAADGTVRSAYPVLHFNTRHETWGYENMPTSEFNCGAGELFETDYYGADYIKNISDWPHSESENIALFNDFGKLLSNAFSFAKHIGVKTCIGTETPLTVPNQLKSRLVGDNGEITREMVKDIYKGIFTRINKTHPLDYYWLWTPEGWTWGGADEDQVSSTMEDLQIALSALEESGAETTLATCGWVLGPPGDRSGFDRILPKNIPVSCINREVGFAPIETAFMEITGRPAWAIPWMEDDPALISPQFWAGRMRKDALDALNYGCTGLLGIHWRTRILGPNVSALAKAAWDQESWDDLAQRKNKRDLPVDDFYLDWASAQFGQNVGKQLAKIFSSLDGAPLYDRESQTDRTANLFRTSTWINGPGGIIKHKEGWGNLKHHFDFIEEMEHYRDSIKGAGNLERFDYWLNTFRFAEATAKFGCTLNNLDYIILGYALIFPEENEEIMLNILEMRIQASREYENMMDLLLQTVNTPGTMGTISNLEQHNLGKLDLLTKHDSLISVFSGAPLPDECKLRKDFSGASRIIVPTRRTILEPDEDLPLKVMVLSEKTVKSVTLYWRHLGSKKYMEIPFDHVARGVYKTTLASSVIQNRDIEYYIEAVTGNDKLHFPATAKKINQSVVIMAEGK